MDFAISGYRLVSYIVRPEPGYHITDVREKITNAGIVTEVIAGVPATDESHQGVIIATLERRKEKGGRRKESGK